MSEDDELYRRLFGDGAELPADVEAELPPAYPDSGRHKTATYQQLSDGMLDVVLFEEDTDGQPIGLRRYLLTYRDGGWEPPEQQEGGQP